MKRDPFNIAVATDAWGSGTIHDTGEIEGRMFKSDIQSLHIDICIEKTEIKGVSTETDFIAPHKNLWVVSGIGRSPITW